MQSKSSKTSCTGTQTELASRKSELQEPQRPKISMRIVVAITFLLVILTGTATYFAYSVLQRSSNNEETPLQPTVETSSVDSLNAAEEQLHYENFSMNYPSDWSFSDMATSTNFPLEERLSTVFPSAKVVALTKDGTHLIIIIAEENDSSSGGIFLSDRDFRNYTASRDSVVIEDKTYFLNKNHPATASLTTSHDGPYMWSALSEFVPDKITNYEIGTVDGYEDVLKNNGYSYKFVISSDEGGPTNPVLHQEILAMLSTIKW